MAWHHFEGNRKHLKGPCERDPDDFDDDEFALAATRRLATLVRNPRSGDLNPGRKARPRARDGALDEDAWGPTAPRM